MTTAGMTPKRNPHSSRFSRLCLALLCMSAAACKLPDINLATPEPVEVNLNMRLAVYQFSGDAPKDKEKAKTLAEAHDRMRNRQSEVQELKNNRLVGEDHRGLLYLREVPGGKWGERAKAAVQEENDDRLLLMRREAEKKNRTLNEIQQEQWRLRSSKAYKGEWIEIAGEKEGTFQWIQALGPKEKEPQPE
jgi:hypothetical protein